MPKKIVLLDIDDTISLFLKSFVQYNEELFGEKLSLDQITDWDLSQFSTRGKAIYDLFKEPGLYRYLELRDGAYEFVERLNNDFDLFFVTDSPSGTSFYEINDAHVSFSNPADDKRKWIQEQFPFFDHSKIIFCKHKWMVIGDVLLDDKLETFLEFQKRGRHAILMDQPHNRSYDTPFRVHNLNEAEAMIRKILV